MSDGQMTEQEKRKRIAEALRNNRPVNIGSSGHVETVEEAREDGRLNIQPPKGTLAGGH